MLLQTFSLEFNEQRTRAHPQNKSNTRASQLSQPKSYTFFTAKEKTHLECERAK